MVTTYPELKFVKQLVNSTLAILSEHHQLNANYLLLSSSSTTTTSSLLSPLFRVLTILYLKQTMFLGYIGLRLFSI